MDKPSRMRYIPIFDSWKDKNGYKRACEKISVK